VYKILNRQLQTTARTMYMSAFGLVFVLWLHSSQAVRTYTSPANWISAHGDSFPEEQGAACLTCSQFVEVVDPVTGLSRAAQNDMLACFSAPPGTDPALFTPYSVPTTSIRSIDGRYLFATQPCLAGEGASLQLRYFDAAAQTTRTLRFVGNADNSTEAGKTIFLGGAAAARGGIFANPAILHTWTIDVTQPPAPATPPPTPPVNAPLETCAYYQEVYQNSGCCRKPQAVCLQIREAHTQGCCRS
jgi:hypothetical protein